MISLPMAKSVIQHQPNEFALFSFMGPVRVSHLWWLLFQKMEGNSATLFVIWLQNSLLAEGPREPSISICIFPSSRLSAPGKQSPSLLSRKPEIEAQFGLFVIFKNQICLGTKVQQQMFLLYVLFKDV